MDVTGNIVFINIHVYSPEIKIQGHDFDYCSIQKGVVTFLFRYSIMQKLKCKAF